MKRSKKPKQLKDEETPSGPSLESKDSEKFPSFLDQKKIVILIFQDKNNIEFYRDSTDPKNFDLKPGEDIVRIIFNFYDKYKRCPNDEEITKEITDFLVENERLPEEPYLDLLKELLIPSEVDYTRDEYLEFLRNQKIKCTALEMIRSEKPTLEIISKTIEELEKILKTGSPKFEEIVLSDVEEKEVKWLWKYKIPLGTVSLIVGYPNVTKSYFTMMMTAFVTQGIPFPKGHFENLGQKSSVIVLSAEDDPETTIKKRVRVHGGDCSKVVCIGISKENYYIFSLNKDLKYLERKIIELGDVKLIIFDPVAAYLGTDMRYDPNKEMHVRSTLAPLAGLARKYNLAIVGIMHLNKKEDAAAITRVSGSMGFCAAARAVWLVARDKEDRVLYHFVSLKNNLAEESFGLSYRIVKDRITFENYEEENLDPDELLSRERGVESPRGEAKEFLTGLLGTGREIPAVEIQEFRKLEGIAYETLNKAKRELGVKSREVGVKGKEGEKDKTKWVWYLPAHLIKKEESPEEESMPE